MWSDAIGLRKAAAYAFGRKPVQVRPLSKSERRKLPQLACENVGPIRAGSAAGAGSRGEELSGFPKVVLGCRSKRLGIAHGIGSHISQGFRARKVENDRAGARDVVTVRFEREMKQRVAGTDFVAPGIPALLVPARNHDGDESRMMPMPREARPAVDCFDARRRRQQLGRNGHCGIVRAAPAKSIRFKTVTARRPSATGTRKERFVLKILVLAMFATLGVAQPAGAQELREEPVTYNSDGIRLAGLLLLPPRTGPHPAAVIVQGSGDSDRNNAWARAVSETIAQAGYAVLLTDKRGSGEAGGDWRTAGFEELADDALAGVSYLASRSDVDRSRIGLVGLSQGGRVVPVAAARSDSVAFVINMVGDAVSFAEQSAHEMRNVARQAGLPDALRDEVLRLNSAAARALLTGEWSEYSRLREAGLAAPWAPVAQGFPQAGDPIWTFYGKAIAFDPMPYWTLVRQPALILYGEEDEADNVAVAESVRRLRFGFGVAGKENYEIVVLPGVGHSLGWSPETGLGDAAASTIRKWLEANVPASNGPARQLE